jgi:hypothetical protein
VTIAEKSVFGWGGVPSVQCFWLGSCDIYNRLSIQRYTQKLTKGINWRLNHAKERSLSMHSQPAKNRLLSISLFALSMGGTFALFGTMPMVAHFLTANTHQTVDRIQGLLTSTEAAHPLNSERKADSFQHPRPVWSSGRRASTTSPRSAL